MNYGGSQYSPPGIAAAAGSGNNGWGDFGVQAERGQQLWQTFQQQRPHAAAATTASPSTSPVVDTSALLKLALANSSHAPPPPHPAPLPQPSFYAQHQQHHHQQQQQQLPVVYHHQPDPEAPPLVIETAQAQKLVSEEVTRFQSTLQQNHHQKALWIRIQQASKNWQTWAIALLFLLAIFMWVDMRTSYNSVNARLDRHERILRTAVLSTGGTDHPAGGAALDLFNGAADAPTAPSLGSGNKRSVPREDPDDVDLLLRRKKPDNAAAGGGGGSGANATGSTSPLVVSVYPFTIPQSYKPLDATRIPDSGSIDSLNINRLVSYDVCCRLDGGTYLCARGLDVNRSSPSLSAHLKRDAETGDQHMVLYLSSGGNVFSGKTCTLQFTQWRG